MKFGCSWIEHFARGFFMVLSLPPAALIVLGIVYIFRDGCLDWCLGILVALFALGMMLYAQWEMAITEFSPEGVVVHILWLRRAYSWESIRQSGILERVGREAGPTIALVTKKGTPLTPGMPIGWFFFRNAFTLVRVEYTAEAAAYVRQYYGDLDYNRMGRV